MHEVFYWFIGAYKNKERRYDRHGAKQAKIVNLRNLISDAYTQLKP